MAVAALVGLAQPAAAISVTASYANNTAEPLIADMHDEVHPEIPAGGKYDHTSYFDGTNREPRVYVLRFRKISSTDPLDFICETVIHVVTIEETVNFHKTYRTGCSELQGKTSGTCRPTITKSSDDRNCTIHYAAP